MNKKFLVIQPPIAEYYTLLVDDLNGTETVGHTVDIEKCEYNRQIIEAIGIEISFMIQLQTSLSEKGITSVFPVGRYISIVKSSRDEAKQEMFFIDSFSNSNFREQNERALKGYFSERIVSEFEKVQLLLKANFSDVDDIVELSLMPDIL